MNQEDIDARKAWKESNQEITDNIKRVMSILTNEEKKDIPESVINSSGEDWSPASRYHAMKFMVSIIGEDKDTRKHLAEKWNKYWDANPEIHF